MKENQEIRKTFASRIVQKSAHKSLAASTLFHFLKIERVNDKFMFVRHITS